MPEPWIVPVVKATESPVEGADVNVTVPVMPVLRASVDGLAETMKSTTVNVAVVLWIMPPPVPVMVRV